MTAGSRVLVAIRVNATPARAFAAFTEEIGQWWRPNTLFAFTRRSGVLSFAPSGSNGRLIETYDDGAVFVIGTVRVWEPPRRFVVTWRQQNFGPDHDTELHVRFEELGVQTRVTVEHFGWDAIPQRHAARHGFPLGIFQLRFAEWWRQLLGNLRERSEGSPR